MKNNNTNENWLLSEKWKPEITLKCWNLKKKKITLNSIAGETSLKGECIINTF